MRKATRVDRGAITAELDTRALAFWRYFATARTCTAQERRVGVEVETLYTQANQPEAAISREVSQRLMRQLTHEGWRVAEERGGLVTALARGSHRLFYELGWNNFELVNAPAPVSSFEADALLDLTQSLEQVETAAKRLGAQPVRGPRANAETVANTLVLPDARDRIWLALDGSCLMVLGHVASVHYSVDLTSLEEGLVFIQRLQRLFEAQRWPSPRTADLWQRYISEAHAGYEPDRYGPAPESLVGYLTRLAKIRPVMRRHDGHVAPTSRVGPLPIEQWNREDFDLFCRSVWWHCRLRVRGANLVLEIRAVPRTTNAAILADWQLIRQTLGI